MRTNIDKPLDRARKKSQLIVIYGYIIGWIWMLRAIQTRQTFDY